MTIRTTFSVYDTGFFGSYFEKYMQTRLTTEGGAESSMQTLVCLPIAAGVYDVDNKVFQIKCEKDISFAMFDVNATEEKIRESNCDYPWKTFCGSFK